MFLKFPLWAWACCHTAVTISARRTLPMLEQNGGINFSEQIYMIRYDGCLIDVMDWSEVYELIYFKVGDALFLSYFIWLRDC